MSDFEPTLKNLEKLDSLADQTLMGDWEAMESLLELLHVVLDELGPDTLASMAKLIVKRVEERRQQFPIG